MTATIHHLSDHAPKHRRPSSSPAPLFPAGDPLSPPDPAWLATATPREIRAQEFLDGIHARLYARLGLTPRTPQELGMAKAIEAAARP